MEKERRPNATASRASPTTPISPRLSRRAAPDGTVRRSKNFRVLATFFESAVSVCRPPPTVATAKQRKKTLPVFAKTSILTNQAAKKPAAGPSYSVLPRRDAANVRAFCRRPFVPSVGRVPLKRRRALIPIAFPTSLSLSGRTFTTRFFSARRRTFRVRRRFVFEKSRSERNDFVDRQPLADKAFILRRFSFRRGVASDLSFKIVPNLDTTFIGLIE